MTKISVLVEQLREAKKVLESNESVFSLYTTSKGEVAALVDNNYFVKNFEGMPGELFIEDSGPENGGFEYYVKKISDGIQFTAFITKEQKELIEKLEKQK